MFPQMATVEDKALLMMAAIFIDYVYFENKSGQGDDNNTVNMVWWKP